jgi:hypothetical protein
VQVIDTYRTIQDIFWLFNLIGDVWKSMKAENFVPNPTSWKCSKNYCEFYRLCKGG